MKKLAIVVAVVLGGWMVWSANYGSSSCWGTAKRFLRAIGSNHLIEAEKLAAGAAAAALKDPNANLEGVAMDAYRGQTLAKESKEGLPNGDVRYVVSEVLFYDPPGATTALGGALAASFQDTLVLSKASGEWKVVSIERQFLKESSARH